MRGRDTKLDASAIHAALGDTWPAVLQQLGIDESFLRNRHGPCPSCGGKDRYRFDGKGRGMFFCSQCGAGDGFALLQRVNGWDFPEARRRVIEAARLTEETVQRAPPPRKVQPKVAKPTARVLDLVRSCTAPYAVQDAIDYLKARKLWPLPADCKLKAHASAEYWRTDGDRPEMVGRFPALVAEVRDVRGRPVTAHVTYLNHGKKLEGHGPSRKLLGPVTGRRGCCVPLMPIGETLGIAEGIETALAAHKLHGIPVWAALNASLLAAWEPPAGVKRVVVFPDRDEAGLEAALALFARLDGLKVEYKLPRRTVNDWNDELMGDAS